MKSLAMWPALYLFGILRALTQLLSAILAQSADQSTSAWAWHAEEEERILGRIARPVIDFLFSWIEEDHCRKAWDSDPLERKNAVKHMHARWKRGEPIVQ